MTARTNARIAGTALLLYIATGLTDLYLSNRLGHNVTALRVSVVLSLLQAVYAIVLGVTLYGLTRDEDNDIAVMGLVFRVGEGINNAGSIVPTQRLIAALAAGGADTAATSTGGFGWGAFFFAMGSTCFAYLFLRARSIPPWLAWTGVIASVLLVVLLPLRFAGFIGSPLTTMMWLPMLAFEVPLALWLMFKGVTFKPWSAPPPS